MVTGECDVLILDEVLGLLEYQIIDLEVLRNLLGAKNEEMELILTGRSFPEQLYDCVDEISRITTEKP